MAADEFPVEQIFEINKKKITNLLLKERETVLIHASQPFFFSKVKLSLFAGIRGRSFNSQLYHGVISCLSYPWTPCSLIAPTGPKLSRIILSGVYSCPATSHSHGSFTLEISSLL